ncbi:MAG: IS3 family transposase [Lachnospiraceae bacterium]
MSELRQDYPLALLLRISGLKRSTYYYVYSHMDEDKDAQLKQLISDIFNENKGRYGYRRIDLELRNRGYTVNHKKIKRIMKQIGLFGITPKARYKSYKGDMNGTVKNLLIHKEVDEENHKTRYVRDFNTSKPNEKWSTDVSEFHIAAGKLYLSPILDMYNDEIIAYDVSVSPDFCQQKRLLDRAFSKFEDLSGLIFHSDQGWQYQMQPWHKALKDKGIIQSMSRKGNCLDNAPIENFFGKLKNEMFYGHEYEFNTLDQLKEAIEEYIEYYNTKRIKVKLKGLTPCEARKQALSMS